VLDDSSGLSSFGADIDWRNVETLKTYSIFSVLMNAFEKEEIEF